MWEKNSISFSDYGDFRCACPKTFGTPDTAAGKAWDAIGSVFTLGLWRVIVSNVPDVGPTPSLLANYISERICGIG